MNKHDTKASANFLLDLIVITTIWILAVVATNPVGNFPLNDDWSFGLTVKQLLQQGRYEPTGWAAMTLISNIIIGWIFSLPFGFSFDALRFSTLTVSLIGLSCFYWLIRDLTRTRWLAILSTLTIAFNPIYFSLSHTFMTDVPFTAFFVISMLFLWRYLKHEYYIDLFIGTLTCLISVLSRQLGLAVPIAFAVTAVSVNIRRGELSQKKIFNACFPAFLSIVALQLFGVWLRSNNMMPTLYNSKTEELVSNIANPLRIVRLISSNGFIIIVYLGLFLLPVLVIVVGKLWRSHRKSFSYWIFLGLGIVITLWLIRFRITSSILMPFSGNILQSTGIGPLTLHDSFFMWINVDQLPLLIRIALTLFSIIGGSLLVGCVGYRIYACFKPSRYQKQALGAAACFWWASAIYIAPLCITHFFDRYLIPVVPLVAAAILSQPELTAAYRAPRSLTNFWVAWVMVLSYATFSITITHDYLAWNRARWIAIDSMAVDRKTLSERIDGGFEFNGLYNYDPLYKAVKHKSWWWIKNDEIMISFGPIKGWKIIKSFPYQHYIPSRNGAIYVLEKIKN